MEKCVARINEKEQTIMAVYLFSNSARRSWYLFSNCQ